MSKKSKSGAVRGAIRNPDNPNHFMVIKPVKKRVRAIAGDMLIADTAKALQVFETSSKPYDPVIYIPAEDLTHEFDLLEKTSHCPLKGEASYYALDGKEIGWAYNETFDFAKKLNGYHAFWPSKVQIEIEE